MFNRKIVSTNQELEDIQKAAHGDHDAFRHLVLAYEAPLLTYLQSLLGNWENTRDIAQETFIAAFYALPSWQPPESLNHPLFMFQKGAQPSRKLVEHPLTPWLYRIATNHALTFLKQQSRRKHIVPLQIDHHMDASPVIEAWEDRYIVRELLHEALSQLSTDDALCITLRFLANERYAEIADRLGITKEAVRKRVERGLVVLRSVYHTLNSEK